jgi:pimeloyl-ACP methyl ester carboxylesterase
VTEATSTFATSDGIALRYRVVGDGPPVFVCHGGPSNVCETLARDLRELASSFTLVFHDYRGSGQSANAPPATYAFGRLADDLDELRRHLGLGPVPVLAYSMGGQVALEFALRRPEACTRLVLVGVTPTMTPKSIVVPMVRELGFVRTVRMVCLALWFLAAWSWRTPGPQRTAALYAPTLVTQEPRPELRARVAAAHPELPAQNDNARRLQREIASRDLRPLLDRIRCPVLVLYGSRDAMMVVGAGMFEAALPRVDVVRLPDVGHEVFVEEPGQAFHEIRSFLGQP